MKKLALLSFIILTVSAFSTSAEAYRCGWRDGHRVCWHENTNIVHVYPKAESYRYVVYTREGNSNCYMVAGHWHDGWWRSAHRVCR